MSAAWATDTALSDLRRWWYQGMLVHNIAARLGTTDRAINAMAHRLQLPARGLAQQGADWMTPAAILKLREWWQDHAITTIEIGRRLGASKNAIVGKAHRLDLEARPSPIRRSGEAAVIPPVRPVVRVTLPPLASLSPQPPAPRPMIAAPLPLSRPTPMAVPSGEGCCWPMGARPYRSCDAPTVGRLPYCDEHWRRSHVRVRSETAGEPAHASGGDD